MKSNNLLISFLLLSLSSYSQWGIHAAFNFPYFHGGDAIYKGFEHTAPGALLGVYKTWQLSDAVGLHVEAVYLAQGAKNPQENNRAFRPHYAQIPVSLVFGSGPFKISAGAQISGLLWAENHDYFGPSFDWPTRWTGNDKWYYYKYIDYGGIVGAKYNAFNCEFIAEYRQGFNNVRSPSHSYYNDPKMKGNKTTGFSIGLLVPFKTFRRG